MSINLTLTWVVILSVPLHAEVVLPRLFSNHMVLQRDVPITVWGTAEVGETVRVEFASQTKSTQADRQGNWSLVLAPISVHREPLTLTINSKPMLIDVLIGDVWMASGQSNMVQPVRDALNAEAEIAAADYPQIRMIKTAGDIALFPKSDIDRGEWQICSPKTAPTVPAAAYFFARDLQRSIDVPVGVIISSWGSTPAQAWMSREALQAIDETREEQTAWLDEVKTVPGWETKFDEYHRQWARESNNRPKDLPPVPNTFSKKVPAGAYNAMIAPYQKLPIRGVIWYQGETNAGRDPAAYRAIFPALIRNWRQAWGISDFPFLFVQLANHHARLKEPGNGPWAELREAQTLALKEPNTAMAVAIDIGGDGIHPKNKQDVGRRLALAARAIVYREKIEYSGPLFQSMIVEGMTIRISFSYANGLAAKNNEAITGFAISGVDRKFVWADAKVKGDEIFVSSPQITEPVAVRYAWEDNPACNLVNDSGLPASPFRTDDWPLLGAPKKIAK